jgi:hypothetical protein
MGFLKKLGKIITAPIKVLEKVVSPVSMIPGVGKVLEKVASPVSMIPGTAGKVLGGIAGITPVKAAIAGISPGGVKGAIAGLTPLKGAIAGISPGGVKGAVAGLTPLAKPIVSAVNKVLPPQVTKEINRIAPDVAKTNPIVGGVNKPKVPVVDPDFNIFRKKKIAPMKRGGLVGSSSSRAEGAMKKGGSSASSRADGIAQRGKTRGRMV